MKKTIHSKILLIIIALFFIVILPNYANAAKVSVGKVKGLKVNKISSDYVKISWNRVSNVKGYKVYLYDYSSNKYKYYKTTTSKSMTVKNLKTASKYKVRVRAYKTVKNKKYHGSYSTSIKVTTKPGQVKKLKSPTQTTSTINLTWSKVSGATRYRVYICDNNNNKYKYYGNSKTNSITLKNLKATQRYKIKVRAYKLVGNTKYYGSYSSVLEVATRPTQVKNLKCTAQSEKDLKLSWNRVSKASGYRIYIYNESKKAYEYKTTTTSTTIKITNLKQAKKYQIRVRAYKKAGSVKYCGSYSSPILVATKPTKISGLKVSSNLITSIKLTWNKISGATGYKIYMYNSKTKNYEYCGKSYTNSFNVTNLSYGTEYKFKVRAYKTINGIQYKGSYSDIVTTATKPNKVTGLKSTKQTTNSITVQWNKTSKVTGYAVYVYSQYSQSFEQYKKTTGTSMTITGLDTAKFYKICVKSYITVAGKNYYSDRSSAISQKTKSTSKIKAGIDVSKWQGNINWKSVKNAGVEFAMIRIGYSGEDSGKQYEDPYFEDNIKEAQDAGIEVGVYFFSYAKNENEAKTEAKWVINTLKKYNIKNCKYIAYDFESWNKNRVKNVSVSQINKNTIAFLNYVKNSGYTPILYGNKNDLTNRFDTDKIVSSVSGCKVWLAQYNDNETYSGNYNMWQYSSTGSVSGISGNVDLNVIYF